MPGRLRRWTMTRVGLVVGLAALAIPAILVYSRERHMSSASAMPQHGAAMPHHGGGVPVALVVDRPVAGYLASVWADPVVGTSTVYAVLRAPSGASFQSPSRVRIAVAPVSGRQAEAMLSTHDEPTHAGRTYMANMSLTSADRWAIRVLIDGPRAVGDLSVQVEATPPLGHGLPGLILASVPFFVVGGLFWRRAVVRRHTVQAG